MDLGKIMKPGKKTSGQAKSPMPKKSTDKAAKPTQTKQSLSLGSFSQKQIIGMGLIGVGLIFIIIAILTW
jgi:hypothetical protein